MKKKIVHIVEAFGGGVFTFLADLANNTSDEYDITILYGRRMQTPRNVKEYFNDNIKFIEIKNFTRQINLLKDIKAFFEIKRHIKNINPDVIHLHSSKAGVIGRMVTLNNRKTKILYSPHCFSFIMKDISMIKKKIYYLIEKTMLKIKNTTIIACSKQEYELALKLTNKAVLIENAIDTDKFDKIPIENIKNFDTPKVCTIGRIDKQKGPESFNKIAEKLPNIKFTWIGDGDLREKLTSTNIQITGWKEQTDTIQLLNNNDVFILTSSWEGLPIALLEAMYLKKICIIPSNLQNIDVITNGINGYIAQNIDNYVEIISNLKKNEISKKAHDDVIAKYNMKDYIKKYNEIINGRT